MFIANLTLKAIEEAIDRDGGARFRTLQRETLPLCEDAYRGKDEPFRTHLGASLLGRDCAREIWYSFRWATARKFEPRMLRLFNRGHLEEGRMVAMIKMIGVQIWQIDENGEQYRVSDYKGHVGGSQDGVAKGFPEMPGEPVLTEFKTHNDKSFKKLVDEGVIKAKWEHYIQMQIYMGKNGLRFAYYFAVNKNDDNLHVEIIQFDPRDYKRFLERAALVVDSREALPRISNNPSWFKCKFCDQKDLCHGDAMPERNCRTCFYSVPVDGGKWHCTIDPEPVALSKEVQFRGCDRYVMNPSIKAKS